MSKGIADRFIRDITGAEGEPSHEPKVIVVRSTRGIKQFITEALGEVEKLINPVREVRVDWALLMTSFQRLTELAESYEQHNLHIAARDIYRLTWNLDALQFETTPELQKTFSDFVTYLSTMLLRVYIEGSDEKCGWELASIEVLLTQSHRQLRLDNRRQQNAARWMN
jgi:hypothetical protein